MPLIINTNIGSMNAQRYLSANTNSLQKSMERLASGYRINRAGDDAAGLALSEKLRAQIRGSQKALDNTQDGINVINIADGALQTITDNLQRMRELAVQASNDTYNATQRTSMKNEYDQLASGITQIASAAEFNGIKLLDGSTGTLALQIGANTTANVDDFDVSNLFIDATAATLAVDSETLDTHANAQAAIAALDTAIDTVNTARGNLGASSNRLESNAANLAINAENLSSSESRIRNVDVAQESATLARNQILQQAAASMLAQANQGPQLALQLLRG
ncbi:MAG: flagellin [Vampirovibrio sp.]|jgi:flagellin|nr:flagellin [Vampirovibrio sp.]